MSAGKDTRYLPPEEQAHVFERYYRSRRTSTDKDSSGLGLAIAHGIIQLHGGTIRIESSEESGTAFIVTLPLI